jgi:hypothetical protein
VPAPFNIIRITIENCSDTFRLSIVRNLLRPPRYHNFHKDSSGSGLPYSLLPASLPSPDGNGRSILPLHPDLSRRVTPKPNSVSAAKKSITLIKCSGILLVLLKQFGVFESDNLPSITEIQALPLGSELPADTVLCQARLLL